MATLPKEAFDNLRRDFETYAENLSASKAAELATAQRTIRQLQDQFVVDKQRLEEYYEQELDKLRTQIQFLQATLEDKVDEHRQLEEELATKETSDDLFKIDPRIDNKPLPNDATMTRDFGERSYITSVYPGFTWRNGYWFKITKTLKFKIIQHDLHDKDIGFGISGLTKFNIDPAIQMTDKFEEIIHDDIRLFRAKYGSTDQEYIYYIPSLKACSKCPFV